ncbi:MAG: GIY-YIG nuclease family protein [Cyanophyceae cyanobacterium]
MWLKYGVDIDNQCLVSIEEVPRGKTQLVCLYCGGLLTAKKGQVKQHHFAHSEATCQPVASRSVPTLPLYDDFNIQLSGQELQQLKQLWREYGEAPLIPWVPMRLVLSKLLVWHNEQPPGYQFTSLGKIPVGALPLRLFNQVQETLLLTRLAELTQGWQRAKMLNLSTLNQRAADLKMYRAQFSRILRLTLYFVEVCADGKTLYKIGVTQRAIAERMAEVERDLRSHYQHLTLRTLGTWPHRGNVERYFKHRYQDNNYPIGSLTEYFQFERVEPVLQELYQMQPKVLTTVEQEMLQSASINDRIFGKGQD